MNASRAHKIEPLALRSSSSHTPPNGRELSFCRTVMVHFMTFNTYTHTHRSEPPFRCNLSKLVHSHTRARKSERSSGAAPKEFRVLFPRGRSGLKEGVVGVRRARGGGGCEEVCAEMKTWFYAFHLDSHRLER